MTLSVASISDAKLRAHVKKYVHLEDVSLEVGKLYPVFGVTFQDGVPWYLICERANDSYPVPHCWVFFELVDASVDAEWKLVMSASNVATPALLPEDWASDECFLERLVDGDDHAISIFRAMKERHRLNAG